MGANLSKFADSTRSAYGPEDFDLASLVFPDPCEPHSAASFSLGQKDPCTYRIGTFVFLRNPNPRQLPFIALVRSSPFENILKETVIKVSYCYHVAELPAEVVNLLPLRSFIDRTTDIFLSIKIDGAPVASIEGVVQVAPYLLHEQAPKKGFVYKRLLASYDPDNMPYFRPFPYKPYPKLIKAISYNKKQASSEALLGVLLEAFQKRVVGDIGSRFSCKEYRHQNVDMKPFPTGLNGEVALPILPDSILRLFKRKDDELYAFVNTERELEELLGRPCLKFPLRADRVGTHVWVPLPLGLSYFSDDGQMFLHVSKFHICNATRITGTCENTSFMKNYVEPDA